MRLLLIDDEPNARALIKLTLDLIELGFDEILEADNGKSGFELIKSKRPHLIITDMKMPEMDGVNLLNALERMEESFKIIIISGFADFEYTRIAIKSKVVDYILKPIKKEELHAAIKKALNEIDCETDILNGKHNRQDDFSIPFIIGDSRKDFSRDELEEYLDQLDIKQDKDTLFPFLMKLINFESVKNSVYNGYAELMLYSVEETFKSWFSSWDADVILIPHLNKHIFLLILRLDREEYNKYEGRIAETVNSILTTLFKNHGLVGVTVFHPGVDSPDHILNAVKQMKSTLLYCNIFENNKVIKSSKNSIYSRNIGRYSFTEHKEAFIFALKNCDDKAAETIISQIFKNIYKNKDVCLNELDYLCIEFISMISSVLGSLEINMTEAAGNDTWPVDFTKYSGNLEELENWMMNLVKWCLRYISEAKKDSCSKVLGDMIKYIDTYYYEKINLDLLAEKFFLSKSHICRLFKKEINENFVDYIMKIRLEKAVQLLNDKNIKIQSVSEMTGFSDVSYFSRSFKKLYGVSPEESRASKK